MKKKWILYHNPRCGKSRSGLELLTTSPDLEVAVKEYLKEGLTQQEVMAILKKLGPEDLSAIIRTKEKIYSELSLDAKKLSLSDMAKLLVSHPILLERPLLVGPDLAIIGRPPEKFHNIF